MKYRSKSILCLLCALLCSVSVVMSSCGKTDVPDASSIDTGDGSVLNYDYDLSAFATLPEYMGIEITLDTPAVTSDEIDARINTILGQNSTTEYRYDGTVAEGDMVSFDYTGSIDGEVVEELSGTGMSLTVGEGTFIADFEDQLVGMTIGEPKTFDITLAEGETDYAGKTVSMTVTVNAVMTVVLPELNDETVSNITDCDTVSEWRTQLESVLLTEKYDSQEDSKISAVWQKVADETTIIEYPAGPITYYTNEYTNYYTGVAAEAGQDLETYLSENYSVTMDAFNEDAKSYAESYVKEDLIFYTIVKEQNVSISESEYAVGAQEYFDYYKDQGYEDVQSFIDQYGEATVRTSLLWDKTLKLIADNAVVTYTAPPADDTAAETTAQAQG